MQSKLTTHTVAVPSADEIRAEAARAAESGLGLKGKGPYRSVIGGSVSYVVGPRGCTCPLGQQAEWCQHRSLLAVALGQVAAKAAPVSSEPAEDRLVAIAFRPADGEAYEDPGPGTAQACPECRGEGVRRFVSLRGRSRLVEERCPFCRGTGEQMGWPSAPAKYRGARAIWAWFGDDARTYAYALTYRRDEAGWLTTTIDGERHDAISAALKHEGFAVHGCVSAERVAELLASRTPFPRRRDAWFRAIENAVFEYQESFHDYELVVGRWVAEDALIAAA